MRKDINIEEVEEIVAKYEELRDIHPGTREKDLYDLFLMYVDFYDFDEEILEVIYDNTDKSIDEIQLELKSLGLSV